MDFKKLLLQAQGRLGNVIDTAGRALGNPLPEFNLSEKAEASGAGAIPTAQRVTRVQNDPRFFSGIGPTQSGFYPNIGWVGDQPASAAASLPMDTGVRTGSGAGGGANPAGTVAAPDAGGSLQDLYTAQLNAAREEARRQAGAGFERARGIYDEGIGLLNKRRGEFKDLFEQGRGNILDRYEQGRGELQASDQGAQTRLANAMRAMGMGGSAYIKSIGKQTQDAAKALGGLQTERNNNENANLGEFNTRQNWADTQEGALQRSLSDAEEARNKVESSADLGYLSDVGNLFNTILSNQLATKAAAGQYTANPYAVNISSMTNKLNGGLPTTGQTGAEGVQNVSINENDPLKKRLLARSGGSLYGIA